MPKENIVDGACNAPHRSLFHALGLTEEEPVSYTHLTLPTKA